MFTLYLVSDGNESSGLDPMTGRATEALTRPNIDRSNEISRHGGTGASMQRSAFSKQCSTKSANGSRMAFPKTLQRIYATSSIIWTIDFPT